MTPFLHFRSIEKPQDLRCVTAGIVVEAGIVPDPAVRIRAWRAALADDEWIDVAADDADDDGGIGAATRAAAASGAVVVSPRTASAPPFDGDRIAGNVRRRRPKVHRPVGD